MKIDKIERTLAKDLIGDVGVADRHVSGWRRLVRNEP
jgi:hypothetical protein